MSERPPGPPSPPITAGVNGWPSREQLNALVATLGAFEWMKANGLLDTEMGEVRRAYDAFMFDWGHVAERWREQTDEEPSWSQYAHLIRDNERLREENQRLASSLRAAIRDERIDTNERGEQGDAQSD